MTTIVMTENVEQFSRPYRLIETFFACLASFIFGTQILQMLLGANEQVQGGRPILVHVIFLVIYTIILTVLFSDLKFIKRLLLYFPLILLLLLFPLVSLFWSVRPSDTFQRGIASIGSGCFGLLLFWRYGMLVAIRILAIAMTCAAAGSLLMALFFPHIGLMTDDTWAGAWRGLYFHKNSLGAAIALAIILLTYVLFTDTLFFRFVALVGIAICCIILVSSRSMTAVFATGLSILLMIWARLIQRSPNIMIALTTLGITFSVLLLFFAMNIASLEDAFAFLGKKAGMSGRFPLWEQVIVFIGEKPIIGYGYEAFWHEDAPETRFVASVIKYMPFYSHNGVLEVLLNGGMLLLGLITSFIIIGTYRAFRFARYYRRTFIATFPLVFMGYFVLANISESHLLMRNDLVWSLALGVAFRLALDESIFRQERYYAKP